MFQLKHFFLHSVDLKAKTDLLYIFYLNAIHWPVCVASNYHPQTKLREGNVFTGVFEGWGWVCPWGEYIGCGYAWGGYIQSGAGYVQGVGTHP